MDGIASTLWDIAQIELQRENMQSAFEKLSEAYPLFIHIGRLDGISFAGQLLGFFLCQTDQPDKGIPMLERSLAGFQQLGMQDEAEQTQELLDRFRPQ